MLIGSVPIVEVGNGRFLAVNCHKKRGFILPGGKHEEGETFSETAIREGLEEAGVILINPVFIWAGMQATGAYCYAFRCTIHEDSKQVEDVLGCDFGSGRVVPATWADLMRSKFAPYYEVLRMVMEKK